MKFDWNVMEEFYENGKPTVWCAKFKGKMVYIEKTSEGKFGVSDTLDPAVPYYVECKSYESARRWVTRYQERLEKLIKARSED